MPNTSPLLVPLYRTPAGAASIVSTLVVFAYAVWVAGKRYDPAIEQMVSSWILISLGLLFSVFTFRIAKQKQVDGRLRRGWLLLGIASVFSVIGECLWFYYESILHSTPFPSIADIFFLLYYPLTLVGVLLFPYTPLTRQERVILWLDLSIVMTTSFMVFWYFLLAPLSISIGLEMSGLIAIFYPCASLLILTAAVALMQRDIQKVASRSLFFLACGMGFTAIADGLLAYFVIYEIAFTLPHVNILWMVFQLCLLLAVAYQTVPEKSEETLLDSHFVTSRRLLRLALPYLAIVIGIVLLVLAIESTSFSDLRVRGVLFGAMGLVGLVLLRQYVVLRENVQLYEEMQRLAITDALTGVFNRHFANETLRAELERTKRYPHPLSVVLIDINGFKLYNDKFGHLQGDEALKTVARLLSSQIRSVDFFARFGGDEFLAILPETDREGAEVVVEKMKKALASSTFMDMTLGVSAGIGIHHPGMTPEQLLDEADQELYKLKHSLQP